MDLDKYTVSMAKHNLSCKHVLGPNVHYYTMKCLILKTTKKDKLKIIVFGERYWKNTEHIKHLRYVDKWRVSNILVT